MTRQRTLKLTIAYDGTRYAGWQVQTARSQKSEVRGQKNQQPTIQGTLERVLRRILQEPVHVVGSGRTDAGAHAIAQVAHLRTRSTIACQRLLRSVNQLLPPDIAVSRIGEVDGSFHARFQAVRKRYCYRVFTDPVVPPFIRPYVHQVRVPLDLALMRREAHGLRGRHNFKAFARSRRTDRGKPAGGATRTITAIRLTRRGSELHLEIEGNGFLHTMVRSVAGTLLDIGRGHLPQGTVRRMLKTGQRDLAGTTVPARGLTLISVKYRGER